MNHVPENYVEPKNPTGQFAILDRTGDTKIMWDKDDPVSVETAKEAFDKLRKKGYLIYRVEGKNGEKGTMLTEFDPSAERLIASPAPRGG